MTERKPAGMSWESWREELIRLAREEGLFDNLAGAGKPLADLGEHYDPDWWVKRLVQQDALRKRSDGSYERFVKIERKDRMEVIVASDKLSVDAGGSVGLVGEQAEGWTFYGVPLGKPRQLRPRLRRAAMRFQPNGAPVAVEPSPRSS